MYGVIWQKLLRVDNDMHLNNKLIIFHRNNRFKLIKSLNIPVVVLVAINLLDGERVATC